MASFGINNSEDTLSQEQPPIDQRQKSEPRIITFTPADPDHPTNWPRGKKLLLFWAGLLDVINSSIAASLPSNAVDFIAEEFGVTSELQLTLPISCFIMGYVVGPLCCGPLSENFGRKPVLLYTYIGYMIFTLVCYWAPNWPALLVFRFLCGVFASAPITLVGGLFADVYSNPRSRGVAMAIFMGCTAGFPTVCPTMSGYVAETAGWRWVFIVGTGAAVVVFPLIVIMPESFAPVLNSRKAARMRKETGDTNIIAQSDLQKKTFSYVMTVVMTRPYRMLFQEVIVSCVCAYLALAYAIYFMTFEAFPIIYQGPASIYHYSAGVAGLTFLPIAIGSVVCVPLFLVWDSYLAKAHKLDKPWSRQEEYRRLPLACVGGPFYVVSLLWLGWSAAYHTFWLVPVSSGLFFGIGFMLIFLALLNYLTDAYKEYSASALGVASTCRSVFGATLPLATHKMYSTLGVKWACTMLAALSFVMALIPFVFIKYGDRIRAGSKFCNELQEMKVRDERQARLSVEADHRREKDEEQVLEEKRRIGETEIGAEVAGVAYGREDV